jgi:hypothetical protein
MADGWRKLVSAEERRLVAALPVPPGLCETCEHLRILASRRSVFVRCGLAETDPRFPRYPALPVVACSGYRRADAGTPTPDRGPV